MDKNNVLKIFVISVLLVVIAVLLFNKYQKNTENTDYYNILSSSWKYYKSKYIQNDGRVIDPNSPYLETTSEGESYAMQRAVILGDKTEFNKLENWTFSNLERSKDHLLSWRWGRRGDGSYGILTNVMNGENSATDADEQTASALFQAYEKWGDHDYLSKAQTLTDNIYKYDTITVQNTRYIVGGNWANDLSDNPKHMIYSDPSYLRIADYRLFAKYDAKNNWQGIIDSSYKLLNLCTFNSQNKIKLPPNWCVLSEDKLAVNYSDPSFPPLYGYDAFRTMYNLALDYQLSNDSRDLNYLKVTASFLYKRYNEGEIDGIYNVVTGDAQASDSLAIITGTISNFYYSHPDNATKIYQNLKNSSFNSRTGQFGSNYYDSNWTWFITYLFLIYKGS